MIIEPVPPHCSRCCPTNPLPDTDVAPRIATAEDVEAYQAARQRHAEATLPPVLCRDEEPLIGFAATRRLPTVCVLPRGHDGDHANGSGTTWRYDNTDPDPAAPTVAVHRTRPSSYAAWEQPDETPKARRQRLVAEALGYAAEVQPPNEQPRTEYVTDRWGQATRGRVLGVVEAEVAAARTAAGSEARSAGYADGYDRAIKVARAAVRAARDADPSTYNVWSRVGSALDEAELKAPPLHPTADGDEPPPAPPAPGGMIVVPRPRITTGPSSMTYDKGTAHYLRDAAIRVREQRYWGSGVTACVSDLLDAAADALDPPT